MVLPASGQLTTAQILAEFNQTGEFVTSSYYRGGGIVPATSGVTGGVAEVQTVGFSGTASNTLTPGQDETVTISLDDRFNAGVTIGQYPATGGVAFTFTGSTTVTRSPLWQGVSGTFSQPGGSGWVDEDILTESGTNYSFRVLRNNTGSSVTFQRADVTATLSSATGTTRATAVYIVQLDSISPFDPTIFLGDPYHCN